MARRVERIGRKVIGDKAAILTDALEWAGTFHGVGARLLREIADQIGLDPTFTIHDREDAADLMNLVRHELGYSRCVDSQALLEEVLHTAFPRCAQWAAELKTLFGNRVDAKQRQNVLDYDDLLLYWAQAMTEPAMAAEKGERFDQILVDEYQDTNRLQASILLALKPDGHGLTVIGDDAQSIYVFRAATVRLPIHQRFSPI